MLFHLLLVCTTSILLSFYVLHSGSFCSFRVLLLFFLSSFLFSVFLLLLSFFFALFFSSFFFFFSSSVSLLSFQLLSCLFLLHCSPRSPLFHLLLLLLLLLLMSVFFVALSFALLCFLLRFRSLPLCCSSKAISEALAVLGFLWTLSLLLILLTVLFLVFLQKTISNIHYEVSSSDAFHG